jgi:DNA polymerase III epsilon subunit-like protein
MKILVFDTETTGLPVSYNSPLSDLSKWPFIIQLSYIVFDTIKKEVLAFKDHIIKLDDNCLITPESIAVHKITRERSQQDGIPIQIALEEFSTIIATVDIIVGHNIVFDKNMLTVEFQRNQLKNSLYRDGIPVPEFCTMIQTVDKCKLPFQNKRKYNSQRDYKWPTLTELHYHLFNSIPNGTHNAIADVMICLRCYVYLQDSYDVAFDTNVDLQFRNVYAMYCL